MSEYLNIAEKVLRTARRPLPAKTILAVGYQSELVSKDLYGKTQHKTLQARLSEDILRLRERSRFYRTEPGVFFLTEFLDDESISEKYKEPMIARRRIRELQREPILSIKTKNNAPISETDIDRLSSLNEVELFDDVEFVYDCIERPDLTGCWVMSVVIKQDCVLVFRNGKYKEQADIFKNKRSLGFRAPIYDRHLQLFSNDPLGVYDAALEAVNIDLDVTYSSLHANMKDFEATNLFAFKDHSSKSKKFVFVVQISCPEWFEPVGKKLSINNLEWISRNHIPNDKDDFDPWSKEILSSVFRQRATN